MSNGFASALEISAKIIRENLTDPANRAQADNGEAPEYGPLRHARVEGEQIPGKHAVRLQIGSGSHVRHCAADERIGAASLGDNRKMDATTFPVECRHCGNKGTMLILAQARETEEFEDNSNPMFPLQWEAGNIYQTLRCYSCNLVTFYQFSVHTGIDDTYTDRSYDQTLYPSAADSPMGLPTNIQREWDAAMRIRRVSPNAFAVLLGRVLDQICIDHKAEGKFLPTTASITSSVQARCLNRSSRSPTA